VKSFVFRDSQVEPISIAIVNPALCASPAAIEIPCDTTSHSTVMKASTIFNSRFAFPVAFGVIAMILVGLFLCILKINNGTFTYTLDDPYIDLALSDQIRQGNYGVNAGQPAAPASSILFPFLLVAASGAFLHPYLPLILNALAFFMTIEIMRRYLLHLRLSDDNFGIVVQAVALVFMSVGFNLVGVVFTGLEHSLHVLATVSIIYGLVLFLDEGRIPTWLPAAIIAAPLLRYEALPLSLGAILVLTVRGRWRIAAATFGIIVLCLASFSMFLLKLGLAPLPSSILVKSTAAAGAVGGAHEAVVRSLIENAILMSKQPVGYLLLVIGAAATWRWGPEALTRPRRWTSQGLTSLVLGCMIGGHALAGRFGWFNRYEVYLLIGTALIGIHLTQDTIRTTLRDKQHRLLKVAVAAVCLLIITGRYLEGVEHVPLGANNVYEQQLQMHRFVTEYYLEPVAVNDIGLVSYHNPNFVLDLVGLASEKARILNATVSSPAAYRDLLSGNAVHLAIVYEDWIPRNVLLGWERVGSMDLSRMKVTANEKEVQFYASDPITAAKVRDQLRAFQNTLPPGVTVTTH
jgi:hypothetical protein